MYLCHITVRHRRVPQLHASMFCIIIMYIIIMIRHHYHVSFADIIYCLPIDAYVATDAVGQNRRSTRSTCVIHVCQRYKVKVSVKVQVYVRAKCMPEYKGQKMVCRGQNKCQNVYRLRSLAETRALAAHNIEGRGFPASCHHCLHSWEPWGQTLLNQRQVVFDFLCMNITSAYHDAQNMPARQDKTCATHT